MPSHANSGAGRGGLARAGGIVLKERIPALGRSLWLTFVNSMSLVYRERKHGVGTGLPLPRRLRLWRAGFLSESAVLYGSSEPGRLRDYLSDWARFQRTGDLDRPFDPLLDDKLCFWGFMRTFSDRIAPALGLVRGGRLIRFGVAGAEPVTVGLARLAGSSKLVLKPCVGGSGGVGVFVYEWREGAHVVDGVAVAADEFERRLGEEVHLVCTPIEQAGYARAIYPDVANTIRILTMYDEEAGEAFVAAAVHRFGTRARGAAAVDNWSSGGLSAWIDPTSGRLGPGYGFPSGRELKAHRTHPDTGAAIEDVQVEGWPVVRDEIVALASGLPFLPYVGWDIVVTDEGYLIIEGNRRPDVNLLQVHRPLLADSRVRRFYERHGVI